MYRGNYIGELKGDKRTRVTLYKTFSLLLLCCTLLDQTTNLIISPALRAAPCATCNTSLKSLVANNVLLTDDDDDEDDENDLLRIEFESTNWRFCTTGNEFILRA